jgi:hypothetical protein
MADISTLQKGFFVALTLRHGAAPLDVYVGQVQAVDERGVRITLIDWIIGTASGWDFFAPWASIESALVGTPDHSLPFGDDAGKWQEQVKNVRAAERGEPEKIPV